MCKKLPSCMQATAPGSSPYLLPQAGASSFSPRPPTSHRPPPTQAHSQPRPPPSRAPTQARAQPELLERAKESGPGGVSGQWSGAGGNGWHRSNKRLTPLQQRQRAQREAAAAVVARKYPTKIPTPSRHIYIYLCLYLYIYSSLSQVSLGGGASASRSARGAGVNGSGPAATTASGSSSVRYSTDVSGAAMPRGAFSSSAGDS
jgi:hypothetical protein